jgi:hypothetical protein
MCQMFHLNAKEEIARACIMVFQSITEIRFLYIIIIIIIIMI